MVDFVVTTLSQSTSVPSFMDSVDFTPIQTMATDLGAKAAPVVIAILLISIGLTLIPKYAKKAARG